MNHRVKKPRRKWLIGSAVALAITGATLGGVAASASPSGGAAQNGYHACEDNGSIVHWGTQRLPAIYPNDAAHPSTCWAGTHLVQFASLEQAQAALAAADPSKHIIANGPYPGATQLQYGSNSTAKWVAGQPDTMQQSWVACPPNSQAVGGGFGHGDEGLAAEKGMHVLTSAPTQIDKGQIVYTPISGNPDGALVPNGWLVEGYNDGTTDLIVRPYVVCWAPSQTPQ